MQIASKNAGQKMKTDTGYPIDLGWCSGVLGTPDLGHNPSQCVHYEYEMSEQELWDAVKWSERCDCDECMNS